VQDELRSFVAYVAYVAFCPFVARGKKGKFWAICAATVQRARYFIESAGLISA
jgi:hypothetical protein